MMSKKIQISKEGKLYKGLPFRNQIFPESDLFWVKYLCTEEINMNLKNFQVDVNKKYFPNKYFKLTNIICGA